LKSFVTAPGYDGIHPTAVQHPEEREPGTVEKRPLINGQTVAD